MWKNDPRAIRAEGTCLKPHHFDRTLGAQKAVSKCWSNGRLRATRPVRAKQVIYIYIYMYIIHRYNRILATVLWVPLIPDLHPLFGGHYQPDHGCHTRERSPSSNSVLVTLIGSQTKARPSLWARQGEAGPARKRVTDASTQYHWAI